MKHREQREAPPPSHLENFYFFKFFFLTLLVSSGSAAAIFSQRMGGLSSVFPEYSGFWYPPLLFFTSAAILILWCLTRRRIGHFHTVKLGAAIGIAGGLLLSAVAALVYFTIPQSTGGIKPSWNKFFLLITMGAAVGLCLGILVGSEEKAEKLAPLAALNFGLLGGLEGVTGYLLFWQVYPQLKHWFSWLAAGGLVGALSISMTAALLVGLRGYWWWAFTAATITIGAGLSIGALAGFISGKIGLLLGASWSGPFQWYLFGAIVNFQIAAVAWFFIAWNRMLLQKIKDER